MTIPEIDFQVEVAGFTVSRIPMLRSYVMEQIKHKIFARHLLLPHSQRFTMPGAGSPEPAEEGEGEGGEGEIPREVKEQWAADHHRLAAHEGAAAEAAAPAAAAPATASEVTPGPKQPPPQPQQPQQQPGVTTRENGDTSSGSSAQISTSTSSDYRAGGPHGPAAPPSSAASQGQQTQPEPSISHPVGHDFTTTAAPESTTEHDHGAAQSPIASQNAVFLSTRSPLQQKVTGGLGPGGAGKPPVSRNTPSASSSCSPATDAGGNNISGRPIATPNPLGGDPVPTASPPPPPRPVGADAPASKRVPFVLKSVVNEVKQEVAAVVRGLQPPAPTAGPGVPAQ